MTHYNNEVWGTHEHMTHYNNEVWRTYEHMTHDNNEVWRTHEHKLWHIKIMKVGGHMNIWRIKIMRLGGHMLLHKLPQQPTECGIVSLSARPMLEKDDGKWNLFSARKRNERWWLQKTYSPGVKPGARFKEERSRGRGRVFLVIKYKTREIWEGKQGREAGIHLMSES